MTQVGWLSALGLAGIAMMLAMNAQGEAVDPLLAFRNYRVELLEFITGPRSVANEARLKPILDRLLHDEPYTLTCDARRCVILVERDGARGLERLQTDPQAMGMFDGGTFGPDGDVLSMNEPGVTAGIRIGIALHDDFRSSVATCDRAHDEPGTLRYTLEVENRTIHFVPHGSLASSELATCIAPIVARIAAAHPLPPDATYLLDGGFVVR